MKNSIKSIVGKGILLAMFAVVIVMTGCTKGRNPAPTKPKDKATISGSFKITNVELYDLNADNTVVVDSTSQDLSDCQKGTVYTFSSDGSFNASDTNCSIAISGTWTLDASTHVITVVDSSNKPIWKGVVTMNSDATIFTLDQKISEGYTITFKKQST